MQLLHESRQLSKRSWRKESSPSFQICHVPVIKWVRFSSTTRRSYQVKQCPDTNLTSYRAVIRQEPLSNDHGANCHTSTYAFTVVGFSVIFNSTFPLPIRQFWASKKYIYCILHIQDKQTTSLVNIWRTKHNVAAHEAWRRARSSSRELIRVRDPSASTRTAPVSAGSKPAHE